MKESYLHTSLTILLLREESEELRVYSVDDFAKLPGVVFEVEVIHLYDQHLTLVLLVYKLIVQVVDALQIVDGHLLLVVSSPLLNVLY